MFSCEFYHQIILGYQTLRTRANNSGPFHFFLLGIKSSTNLVAGRYRFKQISMPISFIYCHSNRVTQNKTVTLNTCHHFTHACYGLAKELAKAIGEAEGTQQPLFLEKEFIAHALLIVNLF